MTLFGLPEGELRAPCRALRGHDVDREEGVATFARASWSGIAEPGDRIAGALVEALGAELALTALVESWDAPRIAAAVDALSVDEVEKALQRWMPRLKPPAALLSLRQGARIGARLLVPGDPLWPAGLDDLGHHAPLALWVRGSDAALAALSRSIALVGARAATGYGEHVTMEASAGLADRGFAIVSGAAYGIDGMAHRAALASAGVTVAFLAGGVDRFYPSGHDALLTRMVKEGAVLTELPPGAQPSKWRFLQRNRLIAAASQATVVLEAGWRSGSLNTAGHAAALGRPLGAVPGPVTSPASAGCHRLIRDFDAVCVTTAAEMAELVPGAVGGSGEVPGVQSEAGLDRASDPRSIRVLDALSRRSPRTAEDVASRAGLSPGETQAQLGLLAFDGVVEERERGWVRT
ncbi:DNA-processing protein DprA [Salinibacterium sp. SYSU T00001]|uniref:DNA-processing protein DprA n=1 Tax=Homoserinimonas sedimenticola TaxID=2986805 RepID=UPI0022354F5E|nr:DNA-processing protein DprA [Salinibacterium sedimenticola]MCW4384843.1 DNA-processing protein DprA [Salinibacterium sedimenticola]